MNKEIVYGDSIDGQATWEYEVVDRTITGKLVCKAVNHPNIGIVFLDPNKVYYPTEPCVERSNPE